MVFTVLLQIDLSGWSLEMYFGTDFYGPGAVPEANQETHTELLLFCIHYHS